MKHYKMDRTINMMDKFTTSTYKAALNGIIKP